MKSLRKQLKHMDTLAVMEEIIETEFKGLCTSCTHIHDCQYHRATLRLIIQCEMHETDDELQNSNGVLKGLCINCDRALQCKLPGRITGLWHCNEYE